MEIILGVILSVVILKVFASEYDQRTEDLRRSWAEYFELFQHIWAVISISVLIIGLQWSAPLNFIVINILPFLKSTWLSAGAVLLVFSTLGGCYRLFVAIYNRFAKQPTPVFDKSNHGREGRDRDIEQ